MANYINFYFRELQYDNDYIAGTFLAPDYGVKCDFIYNRQNSAIEIYNSSKPENEVLPLPIWWLNLKLNTTGKLNRSESKQSY